MIVSARPGVSYADWSAEAVRWVRRLPSVEGRIRSRRVAHLLGDALRLEYVRCYGDGPRIADRDAPVLRDAWQDHYIVTYAAVPKLMKRDTARFLASARTLRNVD
jgi:hypothetical protein